MAENSNPKPEETGKPTRNSSRIWVLLGLTALFFLVTMFVIVFVVTKSFQNRDVSMVRPVSSAAPETLLAGPQTSPLQPLGSPRPENLPLAESASSGTPFESLTPAPESSPASSESTPEETSPAQDSSPTSAGSASSGTDMPIPSPASQATPPPVVANTQEEDATRKEVLKRIDIVRELTPKEKDVLYSQVERARGFTKLAIIPYGFGQLWPDSVQANYLLENLSKPEIAKIFEDPTVVLVLAGYSDLKGSDERNLEVSRSRAENLVRLLHRKTKIANLMRAVGMGGSDLFDKIHLEKNRVVEIWIVRP
jgi:hypothetical protein